MRGGREEAGSKQGRRKQGGWTDGGRQEGKVCGSVGWEGPLHLLYVMSGCSPDSKSQRQAAGVWLRAEVGSCWSADVVCCSWFCSQDERRQFAAAQGTCHCSFVRRSAIKPSLRQPNIRTKKQSAHMPNRPGCVSMTPRQARPNTTNVMWAHGTTAELGQSGGSAGRAGQKSDFCSHTPPPFF